MEALHLMILLIMKALVKVSHQTLRIYIYIYVLYICTILLIYIS